MLKTHTNVQLPRLRRPLDSGRRKYQFDTMAVGSFFFIPGMTRNTFSPHASATGKKLNRKFATRLTTMMEQIDGWIEVPADHPHAVQGVGVWRIK